MEISMDPFAKECLKLFCIRVWYYMEFTMDPFGKECLKLFCIRVWY